MTFLPTVPGQFLLSNIVEAGSGLLTAYSVEIPRALPSGSHRANK